MDISKDLMAASATPLILSLLAEGEIYGYAIIKRVAVLSGGAMNWTDGMLYPLLHRLESQGLITSEERIVETGRKRKYYRLNERGSAVIKAYKAQWKTVYATLNKVWEAKLCLE